MGRHYAIKSMNMEFELPDKTGKIYIVGADTYSGSHFAKYWLESGNEVYGCGRSKKLSGSLDQIEYSATDYSLWKMPDKSYDWIMMCHDPREGFDAHLGVIRSFCDYLDVNGIVSHICYPSSFAICESSKRGIPEKTRLAPHSELEMTIAAAELWLNMRAFRLDGKLISYIHRFGEVYGDEIGFDDTPGLINYYCREASIGNPLTMYGLGLKSRTLTHIADACRISIQYMNLDFSARIINIPGEKMNVAGFATAIACYYDVDTPLAMRGETNVYCNRFAGDQSLSLKLAKSTLPYQLQYTFKSWLNSLPKKKVFSA